MENPIDTRKLVLGLCLILLSDGVMIKITSGDEVADARAKFEAAVDKTFKTELGCSSKVTSDVKSCLLTEFRSQSGGLCGIFKRTWKCWDSGLDECKADSKTRKRERKEYDELIKGLGCEASGMAGRNSQPLILVNVLVGFVCLVTVFLD